MRAMTTPQRQLLRSGNLKARVLATFYLDQGTYRFCDDIVDLTDGTNTFIGANALLSSVEIRAGQDLAAEPVTLVCDANRMAQAGIKDPARVLSDMLGYIIHQRRVDFAFGFMPISSESITLTIPAYAGKINNARLVDSENPMEPGEAPPAGQLIITIDSLAARYGRATFRTRSHPDQLEIDPTDMFFSFTADSVNTERSLYWGKDAPKGTQQPMAGTGIGSGISGGIGGSGGGGGVSSGGGEFARRLWQTGSEL